MEKQTAASILCCLPMRSQTRLNRLVFVLMTLLSQDRARQASTYPASGINSFPFADAGWSRGGEVKEVQHGLVGCYQRKAQQGWAEPLRFQEFIQTLGFYYLFLFWITNKIHNFHAMFALVLWCMSVENVWGSEHRKQCRKIHSSCCLSMSGFRVWCEFEAQSVGPNRNRHGLSTR